MFALLEVVLVSWLYGVDTFLDNLAEMGIRLSKPTRGEEQQPAINNTIGVKTVLANVLHVPSQGHVQVSKQKRVTSDTLIVSFVF